jgi:CheY-like chemotaxis protein
MANVLIVDDNELLRGTLEVGLREHGHDVRVAANGLEAVGMIEAGVPDVLISDMLMPQSDGIEVLREVRRKWPALPVIIMSGGGVIPDGDLLKMARALGASETLSKPVRIAALAAAVDKLTRGA